MKKMFLGRKDHSLRKGNQAEEEGFQPSDPVRGYLISSLAELILSLFTIPQQSALGMRTNGIGNEVAIVVLKNL
jgi:hypothetical protein